MLKNRKALSTDVVDAVLAAALREAGEQGLSLSVAIVDDSGTLNRFLRMDGVHAGTVEVAIAKARSAALFRRPGRDFAEMAVSGQQAFLHLPNLLALDGGEPLLGGDELVGAIGVSGATQDADGAVARAGVAAMNAFGGK